MRAASSLWIVFALALGGCAPDVVLPLSEQELEPAVRGLIQEHVERVREDAGSARAHGTLGLVYEANELWTEAAQCFERAEQLEPTQPLWTLHRAITLGESGDPILERSLLEKALERLELEPAVHHRLGTVQFENGEFEAAEERFRRACELAPGNPEPLVGRARALVELDRSAQARPLLEAAIRMDPSYKGARYAYGLLLRAAGEDERAAAELALGVGATPRFLADPLTAEKNRYAVGFDELVRRAVLHIQRGEFAPACGLLERALGQKPNDEFALNNLAWAYIGSRQFEAALGTAQRSAELGTDSHEPHLSLAFAALGLQRAEDALAHANTAVERAPEVAEAHYTRARALGVLRRFDDGRAAYLRAIELDPGDKRFPVYLGLMEIEAERFVEARQAFEATLRIDPEFVSAHVNLTYVLLVLGDPDSAERQLGTLRRIAPNHPRIPKLQAGLEALRE